MVHDATAGSFLLWGPEGAGVCHRAPAAARGAALKRVAPGNFWAKLDAMYTLLHLAVLTATVLLLAYLMPGVRIKSTKSAVLVAVVFSLINFLAGWLVKLLLGA